MKKNDSATILNMVSITIQKQKPKITGHLQLPGDKSISHRSIIFSSLCNKEIHISGLLFSEDCCHTMTIFKDLGVDITENKTAQTLSIKGVGLNGLQAPKSPLFVGNSGTSIRLLTGLLSAQPFSSTLQGDASIQKRPMKRIVAPLSKMGAKITGNTTPDNILPPLNITPATTLSGIHYEMPIASAQVKSAILLAGLYATGKTTIAEPLPSRDHTERLLRTFGVPVETKGNLISVSNIDTIPGPENNTLTIPADISSAAFFIVLGLCCQGSLTLPNVGLNPTRNRIIGILQDMGGDITIDNLQDENEPKGTLTIRHSKLRNLTISKEDIPNIIDEIPILSVAALFGEGDFIVRNATELRHKESDRISAIVSMVTAMGGTITEYDDGFMIQGHAQFKNFTIDSFGDHRIAMSGIIGALASQVEATIHHCDCINTSFPSFFDCLKTLGIAFQSK